MKAFNTLEERNLVAKAQNLGALIYNHWFHLPADDRAAAKQLLADMRAARVNFNLATVQNRRAETKIKKLKIQLESFINEAEIIAQKHSLKPKSKGN